MIKKLKYNEYEFVLARSNGKIFIEAHDNFLKIDVGDVPVVAETLKDLVGEFVKMEKSQSEPVGRLIRYNVNSKFLIKKGELTL